MDKMKSRPKVPTVSLENMSQQGKKDYHHKFHFMLTLCRSMAELTVFFFFLPKTPGCANIWLNVIILHSLKLPVNCNSTMNCFSSVNSVDAKEWLPLSEIVSTGFTVGQCHFRKINSNIIISICYYFFTPSSFKE